MSTIAEPRRRSFAARRRELRKPPRAHILLRIARVLIALAMVAFGLYVMISERSIRLFETDLASQIFPIVFADEALRATSQGEPAVAFGVGDTWWALRVTIECAIALYLGPVIMVGGLLTAIPRMGLLRVFTATTIAVAALLLLNQVRLLMLGFVLGTYGRGAFEWAHSLAGSFLMLFGLAGCLFLFFRVVILGSLRGHRTQMAQS
ncbi:exosortase R [Microbacterium oxydans]|uniref:exosortase R n=1 Tax=Microbacterium oxydans TaxID=82380 RepID=UPI00226B57BA|nr:exosortase R [Microbacterium oxydans]WAA65637.1 exosortase R [Microbacterium oxydans]